MARENDEDFFSVLNVPEKRLDIENFSAENRTTGRNGDQNYRVRGSVKDRARNNEHSASIDRNYNWRNSSAANNGSKRNTPRKTEGWKCRGSKDRNSETDGLSWRKKTDISSKYNDDENDSSGAESISSTFSVPSHPRSSRRRITPNEKEPTNWRDRSQKLGKFQFNNNGDGFSHVGRSDKRDYRNNSGRFEQDYKRSHSDRGDGLSERDYRNENGRPTRPNQRIDKNESNRPEKPNRELFVGYNYLKALSVKEPHEIICEILKQNTEISFVLNRSEIQPDWIMLIMETVRKLCASDFKSNRAQVLQYFCESPLLNHLSHYMGEIGMEKNTNTIKNLNSFVSDLVVFYSAVIKTIPSVALDKNFDKFLTKTKIGVDQMKTYLNIEIDDAIVQKLVNLEKILEDEKNLHDKKVENPRRLMRYVDLIGDKPPPDDFRDLSVYPTIEDLNRQNFGFVRPNKIKGAYENVDHYLDVQFRLIREDFIDPLRRGLQDYKDAVARQDKPKYKSENVRFYPNTQVENIEVTNRNQVAYVVNFNVDRRFNKVKWDCSKWFMFGSLLIFTRDNFDSFIFATVFNRDLKYLRKGRILVTFIGIESLEPKMLEQPFLMAESGVYFEPYCLVMKALKENNENNFPMKQFIVDGNTTVDFPQYIKDSRYFYIYGHGVNLVENVGWPHHSMIGFDEHQFDAFKTALTGNFTVIQGPPGTGKTYLGLKIVEVLLKNLTIDYNYFKAPILLVCYTNHALDQFFEGILKFTDNIVRVGGQSKSEVLKPYNLRGRETLNNLRRGAKELFSAMIHCRNEMRNVLYEINRKNAEKNRIEFPKGILSYRILSEVMEAKFQQTIYDEETLFLWLLDTDSGPFITQDYSPENTSENVDAVRTEPTIELDDGIYDEMEDKTTEADVLVNEDDIFDVQEIQLGNISYMYCVSMQNMMELLFELRRRLDELLKMNKSKFNDYYKYQLIENLRITELRCEILNYFFQHADLDSINTLDMGYENLWDMPIDQRWSIYWTWVSRLKNNYVEQIKNLGAAYRIKFKQYEELKQLEDYHVVKNSSVVGMTTTCAARLQLLLKTLNPAIVIVEEAAEVLEAHIVVSLSKNCEHVILIGDHKQLKPSAAVYELSKKYNIDVSLFERMINNNLYCPQLQVQHRMRPEISSLIVPSIYPNLKNHDSVLEYPSVKGITKNVFFVEHNVYEEKEDHSLTKKNKFEAEFMIQLCRYILLQGYEPGQITILTTYTGQMFLLREMKRDYAIMNDVKITVVDKYQGEESDIILLSLVRSNQQRKIGFLSIENRVCVALSRAKIGLYMIGNMDILSDCKLWKSIKEELVKQKAIGPKLTLFCDKHDVHTTVSVKSDFSKVIEGGCHNLCEEVMKCGHKCQLLCHKIDMEHLQKKCRENCLRRCIENHPCDRYCYENCGSCTVPMERTLPCGHTTTLLCFEDYQEYQCEVEISVILEPCSHEVKKKCFQSMEDVKCTFPCEDRLECGHQCILKCHKTDDPDHLKYLCRKDCDKINLECSKEHKCEKYCFEDCGKCKVYVQFTLKCGHEFHLECSTDLDTVACRKPCNKKCADCNATCRKKCSEDCKPCKNMVTKRIPDCDHEIKVECLVVPERKLCREKCQRIAPCGHKCESLCGKECGTDRCTKMVKSTSIQALCGHGYANVPCWRRNAAIDPEDLLSYCTEPCSAVLKCGDLCTGTCGSCWQGRLHQMCKEKCGNVLVCGHSCAFPCRKVCPPCAKKCQYSCKHSKCTKHCGVPCVQCKEKCEWKCVHSKCTKKCGDICDREPCYKPCSKKLRCNHDCIGFCGEPCPKKCRICDKEEVTTILFGDEDEEDARFVLLVDCGHIIESKAMDKYISMPAEKGEIVMKICPLCKTPISKTLRYMNQVKKVYRDIQNVKKKVYGNEREMKEIRADLTQKLQRLDLMDDQLLTKELRSISKAVVAYKGRLRKCGKQMPNISKQELRAMIFFIDMFSSIISRLNDLKNCAESEKLRIRKRLESLLQHVNSEALRINSQQVDDAHRELNRYHRMVDYCLYTNHPGYILDRSSPIVASISADVVEILYGLRCFDNEQDRRIDELFEKLKKEVKSFDPPSPEEKRMIHEAMAKDFYGGVNKQGHWFTCTNGHYYCITECGGAMQESNCPECGERIGGNEHRYVKTVRVASDMDGATRPAWPGSY